MTRRLPLACALVALVAVVVLGGLTWRAARREVANLVAARRAATVAGTVAALDSAYAASGSWRNADLLPASTLAANGGASLALRDAAGLEVPLGSAARAVVVPAAERARPPGPARDVPLIVGGRRVGTAVVRFLVGTPVAERRVRRALGRTVLIGGLVATLVAIAVGLAVAGVITRPLRRLTVAARSLSRGDLSARGGSADAPAELGELGRAFDEMAETIEREDTLRRAFAADVAHELRTPLAIAQGELEAMIDGLEAPSPARLGSLHEELLRLGRIVEDVETLAAAEGARFRLERRQLDLAELARGALEQLQPRAESAHITLTRRLAPAPVLGDPARLEQVVRNLLANAIKFTPAGGSVEVAVGVRGTIAELVVADSGPGIPERERPHVFERFWRGAAASGTPGSGIGLAVAAEIVRAHDGSLVLESAPAGGARFVVTLERAERA